MPRQNRVDPFGQIVAVPERGTLMGNRGVLHDENGHVRKAFHLKRWIICLTEFKGRRRTIMTPGSYTELFFLDEATALAAGHRPCSECQRDRYKQFQSCFAAGNPDAVIDGKLTAAQMDGYLHAHRLDDDRDVSPLGNLPDGVMFTTLTSPDAPLLKYEGGLWSWSFSGYSPAAAISEDSTVKVLTPQPTLRAIQSGFVPDVHISVRGPEQAG